ncbi:MAG TPA: PAS domain S-box protein [bacterium (Candidatus Stahlbacteria)]|nr:PAS domain S-box protein [Candidatus Stahlbacteria bacterium]
MRYRKKKRPKVNYQDLVESIGEVIYEVDKNGVITFASSAIRLFGYEPDEVIGRSFADLVQGVDLVRLQPELRRREYRLITRSGEVRWVQISSQPILREGELTGLRGILIDITRVKRLREALIQGKREWEATFDAIADPIMIIDGDFNIKRVNLAFIRKLKLGFTDVIGGKCYTFLYPEGGKPVNCPIGKDQIVHPTVILLEDLTLPGSFLCSISPLKMNDEILYIHHFRDVTKEQKAERMLRELNWKIINAEEEERKRIALELHDELSQDLAFLKMDFNRLRHNFPEEHEETFASINMVLDRVIEKIQKLCYRLRPVFLEEMGLTTAVVRLAEEFTHYSGIKCRIDFEIDEERLPPEVLIPSYRIISESLTNILKHARATEVVIRAICQDEKVVFQIFDNGVGIKNEDLCSFGLMGMMERAWSAGGDLIITKGPISGTLVTLIFPS